MQIVLSKYHLSVLLSPVDAIWAKNVPSTFEQSMDHFVQIGLLKYHLAVLSQMNAIWAANAPSTVFLMIHGPFCADWLVEVSSVGFSTSQSTQTAKTPSTFKQQMDHFVQIGLLKCHALVLQQANLHKMHPSHYFLAFLSPMVAILAANAPSTFQRSMDKFVQFVSFLKKHYV